MASRWGFSALTWPHSVSIHAWSVGVEGRPKCWPMVTSAMNARVSSERISGPLSDTANRIGAASFGEVDVVGPVEAPFEARRGGLRVQGVEEQHLDLGGGRLGGEQGGDPLAGHDVDDAVDDRRSAHKP